MENNNQQQGLTNEQKTGFVLLLIFAILVVGLGMLQIRNNIYNPFAIHKKNSESEPANIFENEEERLKSIDTDRDGLNDYEELSLYETSPYLPDSDSDGLDDKVEIERGTDPSCPEGQDCSVDEVINEESEGYDSSLLEDQKEKFLLEENDVIMPEDINEAFEDVEKMRELLVESGFLTEAEISEIDDKTLNQIVLEVLNSATSSQSTAVE